MEKENVVPSQDKIETTKVISSLESQTVPALEQFGTGHCPVCEREVAIYLAKTKRPFLNCGFCSARIFYNGRESIKLLLRKMTPVKEQTNDVSRESQTHELEII